MKFTARIRVVSALALAAMALVLPAAAQGSMINDPAAASALQTALANTLEAQSFQYTFDLALTVQADSSVVLMLQGQGGLDSANAMFQLGIDGALAIADETKPAVAELRLIEDTVYLQALNQRMGRMSAWASSPVADVVAAISGTTGGAPSDLETLFSGDVSAASPEFAALTVLLAELNPDDYIGVEQLADDKGHPVYRTTLSLPNLLSSSGASAIFSYLLELGGGNQDTLAQTDLIMQVIATTFSDSTITLDQTIDPAIGMIERAQFKVQAQVDPRQLGQAGGPVSFDLSFDIYLKNFDQPTGIAAPPDAIPVDGATFISLNLPAAATADASDIEQAEESSSGAGAPVAAVAPSQPEAQATFGGKINPNQPLAITLTGNGPVDLTYRPLAGEALTVSARSLATAGTLDTTLTILDDSGQQLAFNDDQDGSDPTLARTDARIAGFVADGGGELTLRISSFNPSQTGQVEVLLSTSDATAPTPEPAAPDGTLVIEAEVPVNDVYTYSFTAQAGQTLTLTVRSLDNKLDPKATLMDQNGAVLAQNDDHNSDDPILSRFDSQIASFSVPTTGTYTLTVAGFSGSGGAFELTIDGLDSGSSDPQAATPTPPNVEGDAFVQFTQQLQSNENFIYTFSGTTGDLYTLTARALNDDADLGITLRDGDNRYVADNDSHGSNDQVLGINDARIYNVLLTTTGTYSLYIRDYNATDGEVEVTLERIGTGFSLDAPDESVVVDTIVPNGRYEDTVDVQAGQLLTLTVRALSGNLDPRVTLISPGGVMLLENDDVGAQGGTLGYRDSRINNYLIEQTGTYTIEVSGYSTTDGMFGLTIGIHR